MRGEPVEIKCGKDDDWAVMPNPSFSSMSCALYRPAPKKVALRYRRCVRKELSTGKMYVDVVPDNAHEIGEQYYDATAMQNSWVFVQWLDDDWVEVEIEAPK